MSELWSATYINAQVEEVCGNLLGGMETVHAKVMCRQLGFSDAGIVRYYKYTDIS